MRKLLVYLASMVVLLSSTVHAQADAARINIPFVIDTTLPKNIAAVTVCDDSTHTPGVVARYRPDRSTLVHEAVHVLQIIRYGGCPAGRDYITANRLALVAAEAEAYCVEAYWVQNTYGREARKVLVEALRALLDLSTERAKRLGPEWQLTPGEISEAFTKACPSQEPAVIPGTVATSYTDSKGQVHSTYTPRKRYEDEGHGK